MPRFAVDVLDVTTELLRSDLDPSVTVQTRIPDHIINYLPMVVVRATGGDSVAPEFFDTPYINTQAWVAPPPDPNTPGAVDAYRAASDLCDEVRRIFWTAYRTQRVIAIPGGAGWISSIRESSGPLEIPDVDLPNLGRYVATYELRIRGA
jgi:hypothetical protein